MQDTKQTRGQSFVVFMNGLIGKELSSRIYRFMSEQPIMNAYIGEQENPWKTGFAIMYGFLREELGVGPDEITPLTYTEAVCSFNLMGVETIKDRVFERDGDLIVPLAEKVQGSPSTGEIFYGALLCWWIFRGPKTG